MGIIQKSKIKLRWNPRNKLYYVDKGYIFTKMHDEFEIDYHDLPECSKHEILCECDICGKECMKQYRKAIAADMIVCSTCNYKLSVEHLMKEHGVSNIAQVPYVKAKIEKTNLERYGASNVWGSEHGKQKIKETNLKKFGCENVSQNRKIRKKVEQTCEERYGTKTFINSHEYKKRSLQKYGCEFPAQSVIVKQKKAETFRNKEYGHASKQQKHYCKLFNGFLDYPFMGKSLDIAFVDKRIFIECDFGGHFVYARLNKFSEKGMLFYDARRDKDIVLSGWKCIRYLNRTKKFPSDEDMILLNERLIEVLETSDSNRILVDLNDRIARFEPSFSFKSLDLFLKRKDEYE